MVDIRQIILYVHILFAMTWVGGVLFVGWGVFPAIKKFAFKDQRAILLAIMKHTHSLLTFAGLIVITSGFLLGTVFGPIGSFKQLVTTSYGHKFLTALAIGVFTLLWGVLIGFRETLVVLKDDFIWIEASKGRKTLLNKSFFRIATLEAVEVLGFLILLYIMIAF